MKAQTTLAILIFFVAALASSCKKDNQTPVVANPARTVKFILHTEKDFSANNENITFKLFIRNHTKTIFDTTLATMKIRDIPHAANSVVFEKRVPGNDPSILAAGFSYTIEDVGTADFLDTLKTGENFKVIDYSFQ